MAPEQWQQLIVACAEKPRQVVKALTYSDKRWSTASQPVVLACDDGLDYVVKGRQAGRAIVNEQIVGTLGQMLGAPVGEVKLVDVPAELISMQQSDLGHIPPGLSHGCVLVRDCSDRSWLMHDDVPDNRQRFADLAVLYGWIPAGDHQLIYRLTAPYLVYSVDHGHFFPGGPNWTVAGLGGAPAATLYTDMVSGCRITRDEMSVACSRLAALGPGDIAQAVAMPPDIWAVSIEERVAVATYLDRRRGELLAFMAASA